MPRESSVVLDASAVLALLNQETGAAKVLGLALDRLCRLERGRAGISALGLQLGYCSASRRYRQARDLETSRLATWSDQTKRRN
jgi:hypothetical protein